MPCSPTNQFAGSRFSVGIKSRTAADVGPIVFRSKYLMIIRPREQGIHLPSAILYLFSPFCSWILLCLRLNSVDSCGMIFIISIFITIAINDGKSMFVCMERSLMLRASRGPADKIN